MTDSEKITDIQKKVQRIEIIHTIGVVVIILGFIGVVSAHDLITKIKNKI